MRLILFFVFLITLSTGGEAQTQAPFADTITNAQIDYEFYEKTKYQLELAHARSLFSPGISFTVNFVKLGVLFKRHYKTGLELVYSTDYTFYELADENSNVDAYQVRLQGVGAYFQYVWIENYRYFFSTSFDLSSVYFDLNGLKNGERVTSEDYNSQRFAISSVGVNGGYSINYWLVAALGVGYRFSFSGSEAFDKRLFTPFYSLGLKFKFGNFIKTIFHHDRVVKMKSIYFENRRPNKANKLRRRYFRLANRKAKL